MEWVIAVIISGVGLSLAAFRSTWLIDYAVWVFVLNRGLRRVVDYYVYHEFHPLSPISLTPLVVAGSMLLPCLSHVATLQRGVQRMAGNLCAAITYAFIMGLIHVQFAALYSLAEVVAPMAMMTYVLVLNPSHPVKDRWMRSFAWCAMLASVYGWYQYLTIPPWDAFWVRAVGFEGYLGELEPTKMSVFSTMGDRGPFGGYLGFAVVPMIVCSRWRTVLSWPAVALVASTILLTMVRAGLLIAVIGTVSFILVNRGANLRQIATAVAVLGTAAWFGFEHLPGYERIATRLDTLGKIQEDGSYQGRVEIMSGGIGTLLRNPLGVGLGAGGLGTRVNTGTMQVTTTFGDAGFFQIVLIYGFIGTLFLLRGLYLAWRRLAIYFRIRVLAGEHVMLARALMLTMLPACWVGDVLTGFSVFWLALGCGLAMDPERLAQIHRALEFKSTPRQMLSNEAIR